MSIHSHDTIWSSRVGISDPGLPICYKYLDIWISRSSALNISTIYWITWSCSVMEKWKIDGSLPDTLQLRNSRAISSPLKKHFCFHNVSTKCNTRNTRLQNPFWRGVENISPFCKRLHTHVRRVSAFLCANSSPEDATIKTSRRKISSKEERRAHILLDIIILNSQMRWRQYQRSFYHRDCDEMKTRRE